MKCLTLSYVSTTFSQESSGPLTQTGLRESMGDSRGSSETVREKANDCIICAAFGHLSKSGNKRGLALHLLLDEQEWKGQASTSERTQAVKQELGERFAAKESKHTLIIPSSLDPTLGLCHTTPTDDRTGGFTASILHSPNTGFIKTHLPSFSPPSLSPTFKTCRSERVCVPEARCAPTRTHTLAASFP